jgi:hypothetical protein
LTLRTDTNPSFLFRPFSSLHRLRIVLSRSRILAFSRSLSISGRLSSNRSSSAMTSSSLRTPALPSTRALRSLPARVTWPSSSTTLWGPRKDGMWVYNHLKVVNVIADFLHNSLCQGQYTVDCATVPSLPDLTFQFGGKPYTLSASEYVLPMLGSLRSPLTHRSRQLHP